MTAELFAVETIVSGSQSRTGVQEPDNDSFLDGLSLVVEEVHAGAGTTHPLFPALKCEIDKWMDARLRVSEYGRLHGDVLDTAINRPVMIVGAPRTGTTLLSYMLDLDPRWRSLLNWEASDPIPPPTTKTLRTDPRCVAKNVELGKRLESMGGAAPVHWEWADGPTECNHIQAQDFRSQTLHTWVPTDRYREFLYGDATRTYEYATKVLQILQSRAPGRWVLKSPSHGLFIDTAMKAYPDARFVVTHRYPVDVVASMFSMKRGVFGVLPEHYSHAKRQTPSYIAELINRPLRARRSNPDAWFYDLYLHDLVRDPIGEVRRLYAWLEEDLEPDVEQAMAVWVGGDSKRQEKRPRYSIEDFGLSPADVLPLFEEYLAAHPQVMEHS